MNRKNFIQILSNDKSLIFFLIILFLIFTLPFLHFPFERDAIVQRIFMAKESPAKIIFGNLDYRHPPLYLIILHYFVSFDDSELIARFPSFIFGLLTTVVFFYLTKKLYGKLSAFFSGLILVLSPTFLEYSLDVGNFTLFTFLSLLSLYYFNEFVINGNNNYKYRFAITTIFLAWSNYLSVFVLISEGLWILLKRRDWFKNKHNIKLILLMLIFILPMIFVALFGFLIDLNVMEYSEISPSHFWGVEQAKNIILRFFSEFFPNNRSTYFYFLPIIFFGIINYFRDLKKDKFCALLLIYIFISLISIKFLSYFCRMKSQYLVFLYPVFILVLDSSTRFLAGLVRKYDKEVPFELLKITFWVIIVVFYVLSFRPGLKISDYHLVGEYLKDELKEPSSIVFEPHCLRTILSYYLFDDSYSFIKTCLYNEVLNNFSYPFYCSMGNISMFALIEHPDSESWMVEDLHKLENIPTDYWYVERSKFKNPHISDFLNRRCELKRRFKQTAIYFCQNIAI